jgi:hypothetical protein
MGFGELYGGLELLADLVGLNDALTDAFLIKNGCAKKPI